LSSRINLDRAMSLVLGSINIPWGNGVAKLTVLRAYLQRLPCPAEHDEPAPCWARG
jgi:hypothetical protein